MFTHACGTIFFAAGFRSPSLAPSLSSPSLTPSLAATLLSASEMDRMRPC